MKNKYIEPIERELDLSGVIEEASRCLLCNDAPCSMDCPAGTDPAKFIRSARFRNFKGGAETIRTNNALGAVCARVCPTDRYCQSHCPRAEIDRPIDIGKIQAFLTDYEAEYGLKVLEKGRSNGKKVAIVGSGPSGIQAAASLARMGYSVTIYEKEAKAGGQLRYGIPEYRLPNRIVDNEIKKIKNLGVKIRTLVNVGTDIQMDELKLMFDAIILAPGYSLGKYLRDYESHPDVEIALDFLKRCKDHRGKIDITDNVLVVGGGDVAMDTASSLMLLGAKDITLAIFETFDEVKASQKEIETTRNLGATLLYGYVAEKVNGAEVTLKHRFLRSTVTLNPSKVILAVGQVPHVEGIGLKKEDINSKVIQLNKGKVFITGDIADGEKTVVYAVRNGKMVAHEVDEYLNGGKK